MSRPDDHAAFERATLRLALLDPAYAATLAARLAEGAFADAAARGAFAALTLAGPGADLGAVFQAAPARAADVRAALAEPSAGSYDAGRACLLIEERAAARRARHALEAALGRLRAGADVFDVIAQAQAGLAAAVHADAHRDVTAAAAARGATAQIDAWARGERPDRVRSGIGRLDRALGGWPRGELTVVAGFTGAGKTALAVHASAAAAAAGDLVVVFSAEMAADQIGLRAAGARAGLDLRHLASGHAPDAHYAAARAAAAEWGALRLYVDDHPAPTLAHLGARLREVEAREGAPPALVVVDYDEKVDVEGARTEELRVAAVAQGLKALAKRTRAAVVALSQYSRAATPSEPPTNGWLRYSGKKEQEAALILHFCHPQYWLDRGTDPAKVFDPGRTDADPRGSWADDAYLLCTKHRHGPMADAHVRFDRPTQTFSEPEGSGTIPAVPRPTLADLAPDEQPF